MIYKRHGWYDFCLHNDNLVTIRDAKDVNIGLYLRVNNTDFAIIDAGIYDLFGFALGNARYIIEIYCWEVFLKVSFINAFDYNYQSGITPSFQGIMD